MQSPAPTADYQRMNIRSISVIVLAAIMIAGCSDHSAPDRDTDSAAPEAPAESPRATGSQHQPQPPEAKIAQDCLAFVRSTKVVRAQGASTDCPECPPGGTDVLSFREMKIDAISCAADTCNVVVTIRAVFNPGSGATLGGGLTAWIPPEQRNEYLSGRTPSSDQTYRVRITYKRRGETWRAVEFDRVPAE